MTISQSRVLRYLGVLVLALALPLWGCDLSDPSAPSTEETGGNNGGDTGGENGGENEDGEHGGDGQEENGGAEEGELGGSFSAEVAPVNEVLGGVTAAFTGSAVFYVDSESGRTVFVLSDDSVLDSTYPFEFVVFSTPDGLPQPGTYPLTLDLDTSFMGGFAEIRGAGIIDVTLPFEDDPYQLPPSTILQTFSGDLVITESSEDAVKGTFAFKGFPVDTEFPPLFVRGESRSTGSFEAILITEDEAPDIDFELYLPEDLELP